MSTFAKGIPNSLEQTLRHEAAAAGIERLVVGAVVRHHKQDGRILVLQRISDDFMGGIEELPSGKVEGDESLQDALARELLEETGMAIKEVHDHLWDFDYRSGSGRLTRQFNFLVDVQEDEVKIDPQEHSAYRWISLRELASSRLTPNLIEALILQTEKLSSRS